MGGWSPCFPQGFPVSRGTLDPARLLAIFAYGALTLSGRLSQNRSAIAWKSLPQSATPECVHPGLGSSPFARRYLGNRCFFLFLRVLRCFSSPGSPPYVYGLGVWISEVRSDGFPHSEISGSTDICSSPKLFAACHVLHRPSVPRHPPLRPSCLTLYRPACLL